MKGALPAVTALLVAVTARADVIIKYKTTDLEPHPGGNHGGSHLRSRPPRDQEQRRSRADDLSRGQAAHVVGE